MKFSSLDQRGETVGRMVKKTIHTDQDRFIKERELDLIMESIDRFEQCDPATADQDEYDRLLDRYHKLRSQGYGPQPYHGSK